MTDFIQIGISQYNGSQVTDVQLFKYVGKNTYCRLYQRDKSLWTYFNECLILQNPSEIVIIFADSNLSDLEVKTQLVIAYTGGPRGLAAEHLINSSHAPLHLEDSYIAHI